MKKKTKAPLPKRYWFYVAICALLFFALFTSIFHMAAAIPREIWEFTKEDWIIASRYLVLWIILAVIVFVLATRAGNIHIKHMAGKAEKYKYTCISPADYEHVWLDFYCDQRALIAVREGKFILTIQDFDDQAEAWLPLESELEYDSLDAVKKALYDFEFYCDANAEIDKYDEVSFKGECK